MEATAENNGNNLKELRIKTSYSATDEKIKKSAFGGYNKKDTDEYIANLKEQLTRAENAYNERIEEYSTFCEMLTKEKDSLLAELEQIKKSKADYEDNIASVKSDKERLLNELTVSKTVISELEAKLKEKKTAAEDEITFEKENKILKDELSGLYSERDKIAGENAFLKKQVEELKSISDYLKKSNAEQYDKILELSGKLRYNEAQKKMRLSEFTQKEDYLINKSAQHIRELFVLLDSMKKDIAELE